MRHSVQKCLEKFHRSIRESQDQRSHGAAILPPTPSCTQAVVSLCLTSLLLVLMQDLVRLPVAQNVLKEQHRMYQIKMFCFFQNPLHTASESISPGKPNHSSLNQLWKSNCQNRMIIEEYSAVYCFLPLLRA